MNTKLAPQLVTIEGDEVDLSELYELMGGIEPQDYHLLKSNLSPYERRYIQGKYPELMGVWPILAKVGALVAKGVKGIATAVKKRRAKRSAAAEKAQAAADAKAAAAAAAEQQRQLIAQQQAAAAEQQKKMLMMIGIPLAAMMALMIMKR